MNDFAQNVLENKSMTTNLFQICNSLRNVFQGKFNRCIELLNKKTYSFLKQREFTIE